jgi:hypothetical protein
MATGSGVSLGLSIHFAIYKSFSKFLCGGLNCSNKNALLGLQPLSFPALRNKRQVSVFTKILQASPTMVVLEDQIIGPALNPMGRP